ncbi:MAG: hypothetical protein EON60_07095 [Alphaproteobacteria bacterium]|nr:MAG: hypothetical protein EON60_07095 [Alphaproteobacteria bacterium]
MTANTMYPDTIRQKSHTANPEMHPHQDTNGISTRIMQMTGYRPTPDALIALMLHEAKTFTPDELAQLQQGLQAIVPAPPLNS